MKAGDFFVEMQIKGTEKIGEALESVQKGLKGSASDALTAEKKVGDLGGALQKLAGFGGISLSLGALSKMGSELGRSLQNVALYSGESVQHVQELANGMAIPVERAGDLLERMSDLRGQLMLHGGQDLWGAFGINLNAIKTPAQMIEALRHADLNKMGKFGDNTLPIFNAALAGAGLSPTDISNIRDTQGPLFKRFPGEVTGKEAKEADAIQKQWIETENKLQLAELKLADAIGPGLVTALNQFVTAINTAAGWVNKQEDKHPLLKKGASQAVESLGWGAAGATIGGTLGGLLGFFGGAGVGALPGAATGAAWGASLFGGGRASLFGAEDLVNAISSSMPQNSGPQTLQATINTSVHVPGQSAKVYTQKQNVGLTSGKTNQINSAYQSNQQNSGS